MMRILILIVAIIFSSNAFAQQKDTAYDHKLDGLLKQTEFEFSRAESNVWFTKLQSYLKTDFVVIATEADGMTILFCTVKEKASKSISFAHTTRLLQKAMDLDKVKIGLDGDDNLMVRIDMKSRLIDAQELNENIEQIGGAANEVLQIIQSK